MKVVVTGGAGFIGSHIAEHYTKSCHVVVLDNLRSGYESNLDGVNVEFVRGSITDPATVEAVLKDATYLFHLAALVSVPESMEKPAETVAINTTGTLNLLESARRHKVKKMVLSSSAAVYGDNPASPKTENMLPEPRSPYAITKLDGEYFFEMYRREFGVPTVCLRYFNVFGPRQDPRSQYAAVVPIFIDRALRGQDLTIYGDGEQTRDFVYVKDVVTANVLLAENSASGIFNVARGGRMTINDLARTIISVTRSKSGTRYEPERPGDIRHSQADVGRIKSLGFSPRTELPEGLEQTIEFFASARKVK